LPVRVLKHSWRRRLWRASVLPTVIECLRSITKRHFRKLRMANGSRIPGEFRGCRTDSGHAAAPSVFVVFSNLCRVNNLQ
jgi:hypothetical protein